MKKIKKQVRGITLVALVVTIIVLLILSGVVLTLVAGNNGIFKRAEKSANEYNKQEATEKVNLKITSTQIRVYAESERMPTLQEIADDFCEDNEVQYVTLERQKTASIEKIEVGKAKSIFTKLKEYPYEFEIDNSLRLASINGVKIADTDNSNDDLRATIEEMKLSITALQEENKTLQNRMKILEDETIVNKRINLMNTTTAIPTSGTGKNVESGIEISLNDDIKNYKYLEIQLDVHRNVTTETTTDGSLFEKTIFLATENINYHNSNTVAWDNGSALTFNITAIVSSTAVQGSMANAWFKDAKTLYVWRTISNKTDWDQMRIKNIYGIK